MKGFELEGQVENFWFSTPEVYRAGTTNSRPLRASLAGRWFLIRSDYPVAIKMDGERVGIIGSPAGNPHIIFETNPGIHKFEISFAAGFGADATGGFNYIEEEMWHGVGCIQAAYNREALFLPNPDLLPCTEWTGSDVVAAAEPGGEWSTQTIQPGSNEPRLTGVTTGLYRVPQEMWVKSVSLDAEVATAPPAAGVYPYELHISKNAQLGGIIDGKEFLVSQGTTHAYTNSFSNLKIPWRSLMKPWAAETPTVTRRVFGTAWAAGGSTFWRVYYAYTI